MPRRVDQMQVVGGAVTRGERHPNRLGLDRDPALALEVHRVQQLGHVLARVDRARDLEDAVGQGRLAVVDVGDIEKLRIRSMGRDEYGDPLRAEHDATIEFTLTPVP